MRIALAALALAAPFAAQAACPTAADLTSGGVEVTYQDGTVALFLVEREGYVIEETRIDNSNDGFWVETWRGAYDLGIGDLENNARLRKGGIFSKYSVPLTDIPEPGPKVTWSDYFEEVDENGASRGKYDVAVSFGPEERYAIGACDFTGLSLEVVTLGPGDDDVGRYVYLTELGVSVVVAEGVLANGNQLTFDHYTPVFIAPAGGS